MISGKNSFLVFFVLWGVAQTLGIQKIVTFRDQSETSGNVTLVAIETKSPLVPVATVNVTLDRVKRLEDENTVQFDEGDDGEGRSFNSNARLSDLQALEKLQKYRQKGVTDSPRGVQDQFIEMLGNSKSREKYKYKSVVLHIATLTFSCYMLTQSLKRKFAIYLKVYLGEIPKIFVYFVNKIINLRKLKIKLVSYFA